MTVEQNVDKAVHRRYAKGARERQESLGCPVSYPPRYLEGIPREVCSRRRSAFHPQADTNQYRANAHSPLHDSGIDGVRVRIVRSRMMHWLRNRDS